MADSLQQGLADERKTRDRGYREFAGGVATVVIGCVVSWRGGWFPFAPMWLYAGALVMIVAGFVAMFVGTSHLMRYARQRKADAAHHDTLLGFGFRSIVV